MKFCTNYPFVPEGIQEMWGSATLQPTLACNCLTEKGKCKYDLQAVKNLIFPFAFSYLHPFLIFFSLPPQLRLRGRRRRCEIFLSGVCPFKIEPCEVLQIRNRCSVPSPRSGIRLSSESLFSSEAARSQVGKLIILGEKSDRSIFLTGRCVLIRVRASRLTEANNEPHAEAATASTSRPQRTNTYLLCHRPPDCGPHLGLVVMH